MTDNNEQIKIDNHSINVTRVEALLEQVGASIIKEETLFLDKGDIVINEFQLLKLIEMYCSKLDTDAKRYQKLKKIASQNKTGYTISKDSFKAFMYFNFWCDENELDIIIDNDIQS